MPWFLITGGIGIGVLLLLRIAVNKCMSHITQKMRCCHSIACEISEFSCNLLYDMIFIAFIILWIVPVTWWVGRHWIGPDTLRETLGDEIMINFRDAIGDNDQIHDVSFNHIFVFLIITINLLLNIRFNFLIQKKAHIVTNLSSCLHLFF